MSELKTFDSVALLAVIEHVEDYAGLIKNISKSLKKNGAFVITTPSKFGDFLHGFLSRIGLVSKEAAEGHQKILSLEELSGLLERAGYEVLTRKRFLFFTNQLIVGKKK